MRNRARNGNGHALPGGRGLAARAGRALDKILNGDLFEREELGVRLALYQQDIAVGAPPNLFDFVILVHLN